MTIISWLCTYLTTPPASARISPHDLSLLSWVALVVTSKRVVVGARCMCPGSCLLLSLVQLSLLHGARERAASMIAF